MKIISTITFYLFYSLCLLGQELELTTVSDKNTFEIGERIDFELTIMNVQSELSNNQKSKDLVIDVKDFKKNFTIVCNEIGKRTFGPYKVTFNGKTIKSNTISLEIVKSKLLFQNIDSTISILIPDKVKTSEEFTMILKSNFPLNKPVDIAKKLDLGNFSFEYTPLKFRNGLIIKQLNVSYKSSISMDDTKNESEYVYTFKMYAKESGKITIDENSFDPVLPKEVSKTLTIKK